MWSHPILLLKEESQQLNIYFLNARWWFWGFINGLCCDHWAFVVHIVFPTFSWNFHEKLIIILSCHWSICISVLSLNAKKKIRHSKKILGLWKKEKRFLELVITLKQANLCSWFITNNAKHFENLSVHLQKILILFTSISWELRLTPKCSFHPFIYPC